MRIEPCQPVAAAPPPARPASPGYRVYQADAVDAEEGHILGRWYYRPIVDRDTFAWSIGYTSAADAIAAASCDSKLRADRCRLEATRPADVVIISPEAQAILADDRNLW